MSVRVPEALVAWHLRLYGDATRSWIEAAPRLVEGLLHEWRLSVDGPPLHGAVALVLPVTREDGVRAVLKLQPLVDERFFVQERHARDGEPLALRAWNGDGAVLLLEHDPATGSMLLERLDPTRSLRALGDDTEELRVLSELLGRLTAVQAPPGVPRLADIGAELLGRAEVALAGALHDGQRSLLVQCSAALEEVLPDAGDRLLHGDLGEGNVLAPGPDDPREPWLAVDPNPIGGDPSFDLLPSLQHRWDDVVAGGDVPRAVRRRFDLMTEVLGLDRRRAARWTIGRVLQSMLWDIEHDDTFSEHQAQRTIARSLLERRA